jgi:hypothetical protein
MTSDKCCASFWKSTGCPGDPGVDPEEVLAGVDGDEVESSGRRPQRFKTATRSRSATLNFEALFNSLCFTRCPFRSADFAAFASLFMTEYNLFACSMFSSRSIRGRALALGRPRALAGVGTAATTASEALLSTLGAAMIQSNKDIHKEGGSSHTEHRKLTKKTRKGYE